MMIKADLHIHSKYSNHPSEWFLQRLGASESYTEPELIYQLAKERGMDFVTVTDHNRTEASLILKEKYPNECFTGVESTAYFPEDGCKVHLLIYGFDERQFEEVQYLRKNIYELRDYSVGIYHTDFTLQAQKIISDESVVKLLENLVRFFYSSMDEIRVPTREYMQNLESRGFELSKMKIFNRGIDTDIFAPQPMARQLFQKRYGLDEGFNQLEH